jgi:transcriptional regulator NrdR family protein
MIATNWFQQKWGFDDPVATDDLYKRVCELESEIKNLKEEKIETTNVLYEIMENIRALDARIDIIADTYNKNV